MSEWNDFLWSMATTLTTTMVIGFIAARHMRSSPVELTWVGGRIAPSKFLVWLAIGGCAFFSVGSACGFIVSIPYKDILLLVVLAPLFLFFTLGIFLFLPWLSSDFDVVWTEENITGPSTTWGPTLKRGPRTTISWEEISSLGVTKASFWFVEARDGQRIYWSYVYAGYPELFKAIVKHRPDLDRKAVKNSRWDQ